MRNRSLHIFMALFSSLNNVYDIFHSNRLIPDPSHSRVPLSLPLHCTYSFLIKMAEKLDTSYKPFLVRESERRKERNIKQYGIDLCLQSKLIPFGVHRYLWVLTHVFPQVFLIRILSSEAFNLWAFQPKIMLS